MKQLFCFVFLFPAFLICFSQEEETRKKIFFKEYGATFVFDFYQLPVQKHIYNYYSGTYLIQDTVYFRGFGFSLGAFQFVLRHNLYHINDNNAIGITATPCAGFGIGGGGDGGVGILNLPIYVSYETGAGSTFSTIKDKGFFVGAGYEISKMPLVWFGEGTFDDGAKIKTVFGEPVGALGFRFWRTPKKMQAGSGGEKLTVIGLKIGMGSSQPYFDSDKHIMTKSSSWSFRLYYSMFFDY